MENLAYRYKNESSTIFDIKGDNVIQLLRLFGIQCDVDSKSQWVKGLVSLDTDKGTLLFDDDEQYRMEYSSDGIKQSSTADT